VIGAISSAGKNFTANETDFILNVSSFIIVVMPAADARAATAAFSNNRSVVDSDISAVTVVSAADARRLISACGSDKAVSDNNRSPVAAVTAADARCVGAADSNYSSAPNLNFSSVFLGVAAAYTRRVIAYSRHKAPIDGNYPAVFPIFAANGCTALSGWVSPAA